MFRKDLDPIEILIIEDNDGDNLLITDYLEEYFPDLTTRRAKSYKELCLLEASPDCILLDLSLPDKTGKELIQEVVSKYAGAPVIILTGFTDLNFSIEALELGASDYLLKDELNAELLFKSIRYNKERHKHLGQIRASEQRYSGLFTNSPTPIIIFDPSTLNCLHANSASTKLFGFCQLNKRTNIADLFYNSEVPQHIQKLQSLHNFGDNTYLGKLRLRNKNSETLIGECYVSLIQNPDALVGQLLIVDVSERELMEQRISKAIIKALENEHYSIGAELHDNVCGTLVASHLKLNIIRDKLDNGIREKVDKSSDLIAQALKDIQSISRRMAPANLSRFTLEESISNLIHTFEDACPFSLNLSASDTINEIRIDDELHLNTYRIIQEQLRNIIKHAKAKEVTIRLDADDNHVYVTVIDDGVGFDTAQLKEGIGLMNMQRRAELHNGQFKIESEPKKGCQMSLVLPYN